MNWLYFTAKIVALGLIPSSFPSSDCSKGVVFLSDVALWRRIFPKAIPKILSKNIKFLTFMGILNLLLQSNFYITYNIEYQLSEACTAYFLIEATQYWILNIDFLILLSVHLPQTVAVLSCFLFHVWRLMFIFYFIFKRVKTFVQCKNYPKLSYFVCS